MTRNNTPKKKTPGKRRTQAEQIRYSKVGCKGGIMAEGAHLEDRTLGIWDERTKTFIKPSGTVKQGRRPMFQAFVPKSIGIGKVDGELVDENGFYLSAPETKAEVVRRYNAHAELLSQLQYVLLNAERMGCNCASSEQINRGHNRDCPANQRNVLFKKARAAIAKAEGSAR
jgi:hypothetical protein